MTRLTWRDVEIVPGQPPIFTSITEAETAELRRLAPGRRVLEIGAAFGYSAIVMALAGAEEVWSVDPHVTHGSLWPMHENLRRFGVASDDADSKGTVRMCVGTSQEASALLNDHGRLAIPEGYFGMVFIDGDHTHEGVLFDVAWARRLVKPFGAVIAMHDYGEVTCPGVTQAIDQLSREWRPPSYMVDTLAVYSDPRG